MQCDICLNEIEQDKVEDFFHNHDIFREHLQYSENLCHECLEEEKEQIEAFMGDYNEFHPDETEEEFCSHEDI